MSKLKYLFSAVIVMALIVVASCNKDDDDPIITNDVVIENPVGEYTGDGTLAYSFSLDDGATWLTTVPLELTEATSVKVKVIDGTNDLTVDNFDFDWSASSGSISDPTADMIEFTMGAENYSLAVTVNEIMELVVTKRGNGKLYSISKTTGDITELGTIVNEAAAAISGLRALVYDPATGKGFLSSGNDDDANFYSLNITSGVATLLNTDPDNEDRDGISGLVMAADGNVLANFYSNEHGNSAITTFNAITGAEGAHLNMTDGTDEIWSVGGFMYGATNNELVIGGDSEIYFSDLTATISDTTVMVPSASFLSSYMYVMALAKDKKTGDVYALIYDYVEEANKADEGAMYFTKINTSTGAITEIKKVAGSKYTDKDNWLHCLAFIPKHRLP
jgi:hypothetical protein